MNESSDDEYGMAESPNISDIQLASSQREESKASSNSTRTISAQPTLNLDLRPIYYDQKPQAHKRFFKNKASQSSLKTGIEITKKIEKDLSKYLTKNTLPNGPSIIVSNKNLSDLNIWNQIKALYKEDLDKSFLKRIVERGVGNEGNRRKKYGNFYFREFFSKLNTRNIFKLALDLVFKLSFDELRKRFGLKCCLNTYHDENCDEKFGLLKKYLTNEFFVELDIIKEPEMNNDEDEALAKVINEENFNS